RQPTPPLFPYTTLFRSRRGRHHFPSSQLDWVGLDTRAAVPFVGRVAIPKDCRRSCDRRRGDDERQDGGIVVRPNQKQAAGSGARSEEHTSELQSRGHLV